MKSNKYTVYIVEIVLFLYTILFQTVIINHLRINAELINIIFWVLITFFILLRCHYPKDDSYFKSASIRIIIISLLTILITVYLLGIFLGYSNSIFSHKPIVLLHNIGPIVITILSEEIIRHIVCKNSGNSKLPIIILTIIYILFHVLSAYKYTKFYNNEDIFIFISGVVLSTVAMQLLYSYITYKISPRPSILLRILLEIYPYIFPFYPNLGDYITSVIDIALPFFIYKSLNKTISYHDKTNIHYRNIIINIMLIPIMSGLAIIVLLVSGVLKYKMIAIGSNSMVPVYHRGDAIIYEQIKEDIKENVEVGDILVFKRNDIVMTHRIKRIIYNNNECIYITKGDANEDIDHFETNEKNVLGVVKYRIKYIGYPTIWITEEIFNRN